MAVQAQVISTAQASGNLLEALGLELSPPADNTVVIAAVLRRLCGFMCPCPPHAIVQMACRSLEPLQLQLENLRETVEAMLEDLIVCGDVLELSRVAMAGAENRPTWLFCAPPSFVVRPGERIHIFGIAADDAAFLPQELRTKMRREGAARFISAADAAVVPALKQLGVREISDAAWMTHVRAEPAQRYIERHQKRLAAQGALGDMPGLVVLGHAQEAPVSYRRRWKLAQKESGLYIGRAEQPYGAPLWYLCQLQDGMVERSLLLPLKDAPERASDAAWRIQLSIDAAEGRPATYVCRQDGDGFMLVFSFPLPTAAQRRLLFLGAGRPRSDTNPFAFWLPAAELRAEQKFLKDYYWFHAREAE
jgi:hypothetical protein